MAGDPWTIHAESGPVVATAIHNGHEVRPEVARWLAIPESVRWREEDPLTGIWTEAGDTRIRVYRSRFEVDLNRPRDGAVAHRAWGHRVWRDGVPDAVVAQSLACYDTFYRQVRELMDTLAAAYPRLLVLDLHSYNHRRSGPNAPPDDPAANPEINIGNATQLTPERFTAVTERFETALRDSRIRGRPLDVRENVRFKGGYFPRWLHERYPGQVCTLSVECKKFFMDEWSAQADIACVEALRRTLGDAADAAREQLLAG